MRPIVTGHCITASVFVGGSRDPLKMTARTSTSSLSTEKRMLPCKARLMVLPIWWSCCLRWLSSVVVLIFIVYFDCVVSIEDTPLLPAIRFQDVNAQSLRCRLGDVLLPAQSFLARVPDAISVCTNDVSLSKYREIEQQFNSGIVAGDPWVHVDTFGRAELYKTLHAAYESVVRVPRSASSSKSGSRSNSPAAGGRRKSSPGKGKKKVSFDASKAAKEGTDSQETGQKIAKS